MAENYHNEKKIKEIAGFIYLEAKMRNIPLTKENYQILYDYFENKNPDLTSEFKKIIKKKQTYNQEVSQYLFRKYIVNRCNDIMGQVQNETQRIIKEILEKMITTSDVSSNFEKKLTNYTDKLSKTNSVEDVQLIIGSIIEDTRAMAESNQEMQTEFQKAKKQTETLNKELKKIESEALTDALTGLQNRRAFDKSIQNLINDYNTAGKIFSIIVLDVDHFKKFNDTYGHQIGDEVLKTVGDTLIKGLKGQDIPCRYGGEEFVILLPETNLTNAKIVAEQIRIRIAVRDLKDSNSKKEIEKITISLGVALIKSADTVKSVVERADKALYLAKESGRNNTKTEEDL